jgi:hypothetical protein
MLAPSIELGVAEVIVAKLGLVTWDTFKEIELDPLCSVQ